MATRRTLRPLCYSVSLCAFVVNRSSKMLTTDTEQHRGSAEKELSRRVFNHSVSLTFRILNRMSRLIEPTSLRNQSVRSYKLVLFTLSLVCCLCVSALPQNPAPVGIKPEPAVGKGIVALRAARLIDGTGASPINNAVVIIADNKITAVGDA